MIKISENVFGTVLVVAVLATACGSTETVSVAQQSAGGETGDDGWLRGINIRHERFRPEDGATEALFTAETMALDEEGTFIMRGAKLETTTSSGQIVVARAARILADSQGAGDASLDGGVEVNVNDVLIETESATWHADSRLIEGDGPVMITGNDMAVRCGSFAIAAASQALSVYGVSGSIGIKETTITPGGEEG